MVVWSTQGEARIYKILSLYLGYQNNYLNMNYMVDTI